VALALFSGDTFNGVRTRARSVLAGFTLGQKAMTVLAVVGLVVTVVFFMRVEAQPNFQPLFTNLQNADAGAVVAQLTTAKVPYELSNGGATVLVPANLVNQERVALAEQGLPNSGTVGFSNLEKSGITTSQFVQQVEYQQALEGQLQQTIESIQGIQSAQVNLVIPAQSSFVVGNQPATTASILVDLTPGTTLSSEQVQAIVHLTASATPGLSASGVTVVDNHGDVLSLKGASSGVGTSDSQQTTAYDNQLASAIEGLLNRAVGVGNSVVQVHALLNFDQQSTTTKGLQMNAKGQVIVAPTAQTTSSQSYTGAGTPPSGVLGSGAPPAATGASGKYTSTSSQVTNAVGEVTQTISQAPGQVVKTSVAVLLNSDAKIKVSQTKVKALVTAAAGLSVANGDQLVVTSMKLAKITAIPSSALSGGSGSPLIQLIERAAEVVGLVLLILGMFFFALRASRRTSYDEIQVSEFTQTAPRELTSDNAPRAPIELPVTRMPSTLGPAPDAVLTQVSNYIEQSPTDVARLLRAWASEHDSELA